jgi:anti-sigma-K factor RskA
MSDHDALRDNAGPWLLGALDEDEAWRFNAHLDVCNACRAEVESLRAAAEALPLAAPSVEPPPELKARLMAVVEREARERRAAEERRSGAPAPRRARRARPSWLALPALRPGLAAAGAAAVLVAGVAVGVLANGGGQPAPVARTQAIAFDRTKAPGARGVLVRASDGAATLRLRNMPAPPHGRVYEVWVKRPGGKPQPDALFTVNHDGRGAVALLDRLQGTRTLMVTDEPAGGSTVPSSPPVFVLHSA